ncbi:ATP-binding cassette domain-containing protein [Candidatus Saccharibacteria bacterium]|nr:ATP-binding cassette domain-containing protein [Candidatus Saccharibacteria bacterium]
MPKKESVIEVKDLKKFFGKTKAVNGISFSVEKGEIFGFLGPNGAGKTTAIRCMMDFLRPDEGQITIFSLDARRDGPQLKEHIGYLSGDVRLYSNWTGQEHIKFFEKFNGPSQARKLAKDLDFDVKPKFKNLSSGNRQKLGLILALMHQPELLILDEPTLGLDPLLQNKIYEILQKFAAEGTTVFMSSHNLGEVERICNRVGIIKNGKLVSVDSVRALKGKKIYNVTATFAKKAPKDGFEMAGVEVIKEMPNGVVLRVKGDINPVLDKIKEFTLLDIEIIPESLEEVFLEFYR